MSECDRMTTPLGTLGLSFAFCLFIAIMFVMLCLSLFTALALILIVMHHFKRTHVKFRLSGGVMISQWLYPRQDS